jgi:pimeloyl-ACP methyl ester carboxylesterase
MDVLLVHGSTQTPAAYDRLGAELTARGHRVVAPDLRTDRPGWSAEQHAAALDAEVAEPVLVVHSAAGALVPALAAAFRPRHVVWLGAVIPDPGRSVMDEVGADPGMFGTEWRSWTGDLAGRPEETAYFLYHDCDLETLRWALSTSRLWPPRTVFSAPAADYSVSSTYVLPAGDRTLTPEWMHRAARERLGVEPVEVPGGHCPHVSRPALVAGIVLEHC